MGAGRLIQSPAQGSEPGSPAWKAGIKGKFGQIFGWDKRHYIPPNILVAGDVSPPSPPVAEPLLIGPLYDF